MGAACQKPSADTEADADTWTKDASPPAAAQKEQTPMERAKTERMERKAASTAATAGDEAGKKRRSTLIKEVADGEGMIDDKHVRESELMPNEDDDGFVAD
mmetsp:Transcript_108082/g.314381  ORF Transcript_108082/g.314381 Transcript_108082/m.314381 type:complete len:101 (-) Transcript_108082:205-507(-)|eukprot:CAMPEP_0119533432 /NCGR_PEP_ID=MMETSP1344-20130328/46831_1 /TAXON_ID=236787 /ORGANISM="Florenciella parvula, Strain CCMP2471" /LENGTH=100 /DNA_ID=CAMNT_0007574315 /DNA_START=391 /DNA_END=693 /DNA_ORIENTATION=-